jgi:hypothetical protein
MDMPELKLQLSDEVVETCQGRIEGTEFNSIHEYLSFIIFEVTKHDTNQRTEFEKEINEEQLESLGYL